VARFAASSGSIEMVEWLQQQHGIVIGADVMSWAAGAGQTAMCQHLRRTGCDWNSEACAEAATAGQFDTLRWLREHGCPWDAAAVVSHAAAYIFTFILDYVVEQGEINMVDAELLTQALHHASIYNKLHVAQWLRAHGAQWPAVLSSDLQGDAVQQWSDDMILWARAEGCISPVVL
jgi:hypothetical protein